MPHLFGFVDSHPLLASLAEASIAAWFAIAVVWIAFAWAFIAALTLGAILIAGNRPKNSKPNQMFVMGFGVVLAIHVGYLLAPFAIGTSWWLWSFIPMLPLAGLALSTAIAPFIWAMRWTRPDGASGWKTIRQMGRMTFLAVMLYCGPAFALWTFAPHAAQGPTAPDATVERVESK